MVDIPDIEEFETQSRSSANAKKSSAKNVAPPQKNAASLQKIVATTKQPASLTDVGSSEKTPRSLSPAGGFLISQSDAYYSTPLRKVVDVFAGYVVLPILLTAIFQLMWFAASQLTASYFFGGALASGMLLFALVAAAVVLWHRKRHFLSGGILAYTFLYLINTVLVMGGGSSSFIMGARLLGYLLPTSVIIQWFTLAGVWNYGGYWAGMLLLGITGATLGLICYLLVDVFGNSSSKLKLPDADKSAAPTTFLSLARGQQFYTSTGRKVADFFIGLIGIPVALMLLSWVLSLVLMGLVYLVGSYVYGGYIILLLIELVIFLAILVLSFIYGRKWIGIGMATGMLILILLIVLIILAFTGAGW